MNGTRLSSEEIVEKLVSLAGDERRTLVTFLRYLGDAEDRRIPLELGYESTWQFLHERLKLPESNARRRITASKLLRSYPIIAEYLLDGRLNLTTLCELRDLLVGDRVEEILDAASGLSKFAVRSLVCSRRAAEQHESLLPLVRSQPEVATPLAAVRRRVE